MSPEWQTAWLEACAELVSALEALPAGASALAYLYARLGFDAGCIMHALRTEGLSWGTYQDAMTSKDFGQWHCNAHSNNLVVVAENAISSDKPGGEVSKNLQKILSLFIFFLFFPFLKERETN